LIVRYLEGVFDKITKKILDNQKQLYYNLNKVSEKGFSEKNAAIGEGASPI